MEPLTFDQFSVAESGILCTDTAIQRTRKNEETEKFSSFKTLEPHPLKELSEQSIVSDEPDRSSTIGPPQEDRRSKIVKFKDSLIFRWCIIFAVVSTFSNLSSFSDTYNKSNAEGRLKAILNLSLNLISDLVLFCYWKWPSDKAHKLVIVVSTIFAIQSSSQLALLSACQFQDPEHEEVKSLIRNMKQVQPIQLVFFFQQNILFLERIQNEKSRKAFVLVIGAETIGVYSILLYKAIQDSQSSKEVGLMVSTFVIFIFFGTVFTNYIYKLQTAKQELLDIEMEENYKFGLVFNLLRDPILLVKGQAITFKNRPATELLKASAGSRIQENLLTEPLFYIVQSCLHGKTELSKKEAYSLDNLLGFSEEEIGGLTFTNSKRMASAPQMDQVQRIIEEERESGLSEVAFFQVKLTKLSSASDPDEKSETMIQIQDVSLRVQSQFLNVERQYMSIMNSTVSHEMRNPLNAIMSQIGQQRAHIEATSKFFGNLKANEPEQAELAQIQKGFAASLEVSEASTNLIRFNVEDLLALPQLKAGKFTKNLQEVDVRKGTEEIVRIMQHQADAKQVRMDTVFEGFPSSDNGTLSLHMDLQRFQQVVLNFLSNALKFTEKQGHITVLLQYIGKTTDREQQLGLRREDAEARASLQAVIDAFYGPGYLGDSESDSDEDGEGGSSQDEFELLGNEEKVLSLAEKFAFRAHSRAQLGKILMKETRPKILLSVLDSGLGIKVADQMKLFKLFGRLKSNQKVNTKGVGLGLSITKMIAEEFEGTALVHSKKGKGSMFQASLSLITDGTNHMKKSKDEEALAAKLFEISSKQMRRIQKNQQLKKAGLPLPGAHLRILVVDDEAYNIEVLRAMITSLGVSEQRLVSCLSGKEALAELASSVDPRTQKSDIGIVFTDLSMPIIDGYRLAWKTRRLFRKHGYKREEQPMIVALTGHTESEYYLHALSKGVDSVNSKPVSREAIKRYLLECGYEV